MKSPAACTLLANGLIAAQQTRVGLRQLAPDRLAVRVQTQAVLTRSAWLRQQGQAVIHGAIVLNARRAWPVSREVDLDLIEPIYRTRSKHFKQQEKQQEVKLVKGIE